MCNRSQWRRIGSPDRRCTGRPRRESRQMWRCAGRPPRDHIVRRYIVVSAFNLVRCWFVVSIIAIFIIGLVSTTAATNESRIHLLSDVGMKAVSGSMMVVRRRRRFPIKMTIVMRRREFVGGFSSSFAFVFETVGGIEIFLVCFVHGGIFLCDW